MHSERRAHYLPLAKKWQNTLTRLHPYVTAKRATAPSCTSNSSASDARRAPIALEGVDAVDFSSHRHPYVHRDANSRREARPPACAALQKLACTVVCKSLITPTVPRALTTHLIKFVQTFWV